jgi:hypothetical protein
LIFFEGEVLAGSKAPRPLNRTAPRGPLARVRPLVGNAPLGA